MITLATTCGIFIINKFKQILTCHPTGHHPLQLDIPKGCLDRGETVSQCVVRELLEETGIDYYTLQRPLIDISAIHGTFIYKHKKKQLYTFMLQLNDTIDVTTLKCTSMVTSVPIPFPEVDSFAWIEYNERELLHESQQRAIEVINDQYNIFDLHSSKDENTQYITISKSNNYG